MNTYRHTVTRSHSSATHTRSAQHQHVSHERLHACVVSAQTCSSRDVQHVFASPWSSRRPRHCSDILSFFSVSYVLVTVKAFSWEATLSCKVTTSLHTWT